MPCSFVTVAHADDEWLLRLQARSMRLHLTRSLVGEIIVVENFDAGRRVAWRDRLRLEYGDLAGRVRFVPAPLLAPMPQAAGWWSQQVLKLLACRLVACRRYVVLDAKNHLIRPLDRRFLEGDDGRMLSRRYDYRRHPLRCFLERTLLFCGVPPAAHVGWFMAAGTPFTIERADAQEAIAFVEAGTGKPFADSFIEAGITEFFLLAARLMQRGLLEDRYDFSQIACPVVWDRTADPDALLSAIRDAEEGQAPIFAVHRRVIPKLDDALRGSLGRFWTRRGLFGCEEEAVAELLREGTALHTVRS